LTKNYGYKTTLNANLNSLECLTNLSFKHFLNAESARLDVDINYPLRWNDLQVWNINLDLQKSDIYFTFYHKVFFQQLVNDWSSRYMGDLRKFVPYIYDIKLKASDLELILPCNQYNWIDVTILENNAFFEVLAKNAKLDLAFKFEDYLPENMKIPMDVKIFDACARFFVPPTNMNLALMKILRKKLKYISIENGIQTQFDKKRWSKFNKTNLQNEQTTEATESNPVSNDDNVDTAPTSEQNQSQPSKQANQSFKTSFSNKQANKTFKQKTNNQKNKKNLKSENDTSTNNNNNFKINRNNKNQINHQNETHLDFSENWFECWHADYASVIMDYDYNPCPVLDWNLKSNFIKLSYFRSIKTLLL